VDQAILLAQLLVLLAVANGTPVVAAKLLGKRGAFPLDGNATLADGQPIFGAAKTVRGVVLAIAATTLAATVFGLSPGVGCVVAVGAMSGDLLSSFLKRRLRLESSSRFTGLDHIPEALLPLSATAALLPLSALSVGVGTLLFFAGALVLSRVFFRLRLRDRPY
jgi:hypothetical protein